MATLSDESFLTEVDHLIHGRESALKVEPTPPADTPPVEEPPVVEPPAGEDTPPVVDTPPATDDTPPVEDEGKEKEGEETDPPADTPPASTEPDYKAAYEKLFGTPIRAGGQDITLTDVDEAVSLIQKGVGFHKKLNQMHGQLKYVEMLKNNDLLDESKLSFLIDVSKKSPAAIKKLLDESKIDPLTLDTTEASNYAPSDYRVTDEQVRFQMVVDDLTDSTHGTSVLQDAKGWDQVSKAEVYKTPDVLTYLAQQKEQGRYDLIKAQVERQKVLGNIPVTEPFLTSYTRVGQQMMQAGAFGKPTATVTPTPVAQKIVTPPTPPNAKRAAIAAPPKGTSSGVQKQLPDTKRMTDEEFEKHFKATFNI